MSVNGSDVLVDTNVLIYATLEDDGRGDIARSILLKNSEMFGQRYITTQNLGEMYPNLTGPKMSTPDPPEMARAKINAIAELPGLIVLPLTMDVVTIALELCEKYKITRQNYYDMQLAAIMLRYRIQAIVTENVNDFRMIEGISAINPFS